MSRQIIVEEKVYDVLEEMKKRVSRRASFNTIVKELIRKSAGSLQSDKRFISEMRQYRQRREIHIFLKNLEDDALISDKIYEYDLVPVIFLLINNKWIEAASLVNQKAQFIQHALDQYHENLELVASKQLKKAKSRSSSGGVQDGVQNAKDGTSQTRK